MTPPDMTPLDQVYAYHERTKHRLERYAAGPSSLDWDHQPDPFRRFAGCETLALPLVADELEHPWQALFAHPPKPLPLGLRTIGALLELSLGLAAWKQYGDARWALRCNPSSGNLHPTEGCLIAAGLPDLADGVYHYAPAAHLLERRCHVCIAGSALYIGLSGIIWREAWKYGERGFRYVQLDSGHALGALAYAAAVLGWRLEPVPVGDAQLATLLGVDRGVDFAGAERETPDLLLRVVTGEVPPDLKTLVNTCREGDWHGRANRLGGEPHLDWPAIDLVDAATHTEQALPQPPAAGTFPPPLETDCRLPTSTLIRTRRSAQGFDGSTVLSRPALHRILDALLPRPDRHPWTAWPHAARLHLVLFVHRVDDLSPGLYAFLRDPRAETALRAAMNPQFDWGIPADCPPGFPLRHLISAKAQNAARTVSCHQEIAADSCFSLAMVAEFDAALALHPAEYRRLYWEAGLIGQALYLEAEAAGVRGTGIGCFFDDAVHLLLGLEGTAWQDLYHFTVGGPLTDTRIQTQPPYRHLAADR